MRNLYNKITWIICYWCVLALPTLSQGQVFQQIYVSDFNQSVRDIIETSDGGYILAGMTENYTLGDSNIYILKTNNLGDITWTRSYGANSPDYANSIIQLSDGSYMVAGYTKSYGAGGTDSWILKLNSAGDTLWTKTYGGPGEDEAKEIIPSADGNFVVVGRTNSSPSLGHDAYLMKTDPSGNILWKRTYGGAQFESGNSVRLCSDGGFIIAGQTASEGSGGSDQWIVRTNSSGDSLWSKTFGSTAFDEAKYIIVNPDGTFVFCGNNYSSGDSDIQVIKTDAAGNIIWDKSYGGNDKDVSKTIEATSDGGYIVSAVSRSFGWINPDMWLLKLTASGDTLWTRNYGSWDHEHAYAARQTSDNGLIAVGHSKSYGPKMRIMFIKLNQEGTFVSVDQLFADNNHIDIYPNPSDGLVKINISGNLASYSLLVTNTLGQKIYSAEGTENSTELKSINLTGNKPGIYFLNVQSENRTSITKIILR